MMKQDSMVERFRSEVYPIGWRLQYHEKERKHELSLFDGAPETSYRTDYWDSRILVKDFLLTLSIKGRTILYKLYVEDLTEK
ncbi:sigma-70 family RNA polymerase sigma factor [Paenibacillus gallinarum]|uniref:Sigma-70 family RNA polymerase sigma factor n=1 Tax=Paenibacillus gallinarum TaxID=2762232 RepID=A0ABR8T3U7_9BACL|nr:sigma-70 family RNA polymerase sigma factor [Paenibacillus gallinarum]MBD7970436.1 sigma-70 family RNA polymerase sigma factor [Paenibacillus gallinarum]